MHVIETVRDRLGAPAVPLQVPLYDDETPVGVVDILTREGWRFPEGAREMEAAEGVAIPAYSIFRIYFEKVAKIVEKRLKKS